MGWVPRRTRSYKSRRLTSSALSPRRKRVICITFLSKVQPIHFDSMYRSCGVGCCLLSPLLALSKNLRVPSDLTVAEAVLLKIAFVLCYVAVICGCRDAIVSHSMDNMR